MWGTLSSVWKEKHWQLHSLPPLRSLSSIQCEYRYTAEYSPETLRALERHIVHGWLTIVMGCWIWHGACTLWHDSVFWKKTNIQVTDSAARHVMSSLNINATINVFCKCTKCGLIFMSFFVEAVLVLCSCTCVTPPVNCPLAVWDIAVRFWVSVQSTSEDGFHLLSLGSFILQPESTRPCQSTSTHSDTAAA